MQATKELWFIGASLEDQNYANEVVTSHSNFLHFSLPFLFFVPATQAISVHNRHFGPLSPFQVS